MPNPTPASSWTATSTRRAPRSCAIAPLACLIAGAGCLEPLGSARPALLPVLPVAVRLAPGRDAFLQALVLKNYGAREVFFEHDRADWLAVSPDLLPEDLGVTPLWVVSTRREQRPGAAAVFSAA